MDVLDRVRVGHQQARRPEPVGQVVAARLELGREPAVEDDDPGPDRREPRSRPGLQLDHLPLRIRRVDPGAATAALGLHGDDLADLAPPAVTTPSTAAGTSSARISSSRQPGRSTSAARVPDERVAPEELGVGPPSPCPGRLRSGARRIGIAQAGRRRQFDAAHVALRPDELAAEVVGVERRQSPSVMRDGVHGPGPAR